MAQRVYTMRVDDLDGTKATDTVRFGLDGREYEIDLSAANAQRLREQVLAWAAHARRVAPAPAPGVVRAPARRDPEQTRAIRSWAARNGYQVNPRARIPDHVAQAYDDAHTTRTWTPPATRTAS